MQNDKYIAAYVTRPDGNGLISAWRVERWYAAMAQTMLQGAVAVGAANAIGWGLYGLVELASKVL